MGHRSSVVRGEGKWALPSARAAEIALRTQQVIAHESGVTNTVDPLAGSYLIERLTNELEHRAQTYIAQIDQLGGAVRAIAQGFYQREIQLAAWRWQQDVEQGKRVIVGVNRYAKAEESRRGDLPAVPDQVRDERVTEEQKERLRTAKAARDATRVAAALARLMQGAQSDVALMPVILDCVENWCTLGEIADVFRQVWGEYRETVVW